ncbi:MAG: hypothetical protein RLZZ360_233 [Candidatus Parcubacteria bacterium]|jgi:hypothetical protein
MQIANTFASKALVAVVAAAMIFSAFVTPAKAATAEELQKMINDLMAQMAALQGGSTTTTGGSSAAVCPFTWTRDLKTGATGADVMTLQKFLNANADTRVAATGAGSAGMETEYFGPATAAAVSKFQVMYRADILTPAGLTNPTGFFGPSTRAKANALCVAGGSTGGDEEEEEEEEESGDLSGEASLEDVVLDSASDDEVEEGEEEAPIAEMQVTFEDGDASISRLDITLADEDASSDVWDVLETVSLWVDGEMVAEMDASDEDEYLDTTSASGTIRFSGLDIVAMEDEDLDITIAATLQSSIDNADLDSYAVSVDAIRFFDADGVATTEEGDFDLGLEDAVTFTIVAEGADDEIIVKASENDPVATTLKLEDDQKSDFMHVFSFDIDTDDSTNDIELNEVAVTVVVSSSTYAAIVDDAELEIDGTTIDDVTVNSGTSTVVLTFDVDGDVTIDAGDRVEAKLNLKFKSLALGNEGMTVTAQVTSANADAIVAEGADDIGTGAISGAATGDAHTLRTTGLDVTLDSDSAVVTTGDSANDDYATYEIVLDVTAFEQDVFISTNQATSASVSIVNSAGATVSGTSSVVLDSSADVEGGSFKINEGETESVTITVTFDATTAGASARLQLNSLVFGETDGANNQTWLALPAEDFRTDIVTLVN